MRKVGIQDGDTLEVYESLDSSSSNDDEQWLAQLAATEEKIIQLQNEVEFKRAELESAAIENETIATMVSSVRSGLRLLRQKRRRCRSLRTVRG